MNKESKDQVKKCFIITHIGDVNSTTFRKTKGVIESVIKPVLFEYGFDDIKPAYEISVSGMITTQIINRIINDDLVIVNLTGNNPNVMYELCLRHVVAKPIVHICENGTILPFDIKDNRTIFYENDMLGVEELKNELKNYLNELNYSKEYLDNPIYNAKQVDLLLKHVSDNNEKSIEFMLLQKIYENVVQFPDIIKKQSYEGNYLSYDYKIYVPEPMEPFDDVNIELYNELQRRQVVIIERKQDTWYCRNIGDTSHKEIKQVIDQVAKKYNVKILFELGNSHLYFI